MTDRIRHLTVTLDKDYRDDDVESIVNAICQIRGVGAVTPKIVEGLDHLARSAVRVELEGKLHQAIDSVFRQNEIRKLATDR